MSAPAQEVTTLSGELEVLKPEIEKVLPEHVTADKFMRVVSTAIAQDPQLRNADRRSLLTSCVKAATDGLVPDGREAALVIFGGKVAYMPMVSGILKKCRNSGELQSIMSNVVYEHDDFNYWIDDLGEHVTHKPNITGDRGEFLCVYAIAKTKDGGVYVEVMSRSEVEQVRSVSKAKNNGPWVTWYNEMARKTAIRRLSKRLPMSTDIESVINNVDQFYDMRRGGEPAQSGTQAAKKFLGLPELPGDAPDGVDPETGEVEGTAGQTDLAGGPIPQYDEGTAIALLGAKRTTKTLDEAWDEIVQDFGDTGRELPQSVKDKYDERRGELGGSET